jgi:hypothetical protein
MSLLDPNMEWLPSSRPFLELFAVQAVAPLTFSDVATHDVVPGSLAGGVIKGKKSKSRSSLFRPQGHYGAKVEALQQFSPVQHDERVKRSDRGLPFWKNVLKLRKRSHLVHLDTEITTILTLVLDISLATHLVV